VRPENRSPIEVFNGSRPDFSRVHPTGVLCYWHVDKKHRDDPKLGNAAAVGVYLGPANAFGARGHLVHTANNRLRVVSHVLVDTDTKPFHIGLLKELLKQLSRVTGLDDKLAINPDALLLPDGSSALNLLSVLPHRLL